MKPLIIGIAGGSGSGKSTVARNVAQAIAAESVAFIDMDAYYNNYAHLPMEERRAINWDHPASFDWELLVAQLAQLSSGTSIDKRCTTTSRTPAPTAPWSYRRRASW
jgi:uridine kinase